MALNFPANTSLPYVDPISGLKYIYNSAVGAWEAAIQPPAVIADAPPALNIPGFLWWDNTNGALYIWYEDENSAQWVDATASGGAGPSTAYIQAEAPEGAIVGELWWDCDNGRLYIYYDDGGSKQWIQATTGSEGNAVVNYGVRATAGSSQPTNAKVHDLWYNTTDKSLYINVKPQGQNTAVWTKSHDITDPASFVSNVTAGDAIAVTGTADKPVIGVKEATVTQSGTIKIATVGDAAGFDKTKALTAGVLKDTIASFVNTSNFATKAELATSIKDGNPVGTVIDYAGTGTPPGYLPCNGSAINRIQYVNLFQVIGLKFGVGDGQLTFNLPTIAGSAITNKYIKF